LLAMMVAFTPLSAVASEDETPPIPVRAWTPEVFKFNGQEGLWFPLEQAEQLLWEVTFHVPELRLHILDQTNLGETYEKQIDVLKKTIILERDVSKMHVDMAEYWKKNYLEQVDRDEGLLHNPTFWLTVGVIGGAAATIGIAAAIHEVTN